MSLWTAIAGYVPELYFWDDNQVAIQILKNGRNPTMRYMGRTHRINVAWLLERFKDPNLRLV